MTGTAGLSIPNKFPYAVPQPGDTNIDWAGLYYNMQLATFDPKYSVPYAQSFNLNIQRALPSNVILQIGYVGTLRSPNPDTSISIPLRSLTSRSELTAM